MSKQSNEVMAASKQSDPRARTSRRDAHKPNRDEFVKAQENADTLGLDEKVSDGLRRAMLRFQNSPLTLMMEVLNDGEQPWERRLDCAQRAFPYLHRKLEDKHGTPAQGPAGEGAGSGPRGPTINLSVNRPQAATVTVQQAAPARNEEAQTQAAQPAPAAEPVAMKSEPRKAFKKPAKKSSK